MSSHTGVNASDTSTRYPTHSTWMTTLLIVAGAAATGFGARYLAFAPHTGADAEPEVAQVLDDFWSAADAGDYDGVNAVLVDGWATFFDYNSANKPASVIRTRVEAWAVTEGPSPVGEPWVIDKAQGGWEVVQRGTVDGDERFYYFLIVDTDSDGTGTEAPGLQILFVDDSPLVGLG